MGDSAPTSAELEALIEQIVEKKLKLYVVDAYQVAREAQMGVRINTAMQTCFFKLANVMDTGEAIAEIKKMMLERAV